MANEVSVREATDGDAGAVHALVTELAGTVGDSQPDFEAIRARLSELLDEPRARVLVAEDGGADEAGEAGEAGAVVGVASLWIKPDLAHGDTVVEVPTLVVSEGSRRSGVGRLLVDAVRAVAAENDADLVELVATRDNETARSFYRSLGFVETDLVALEFFGDMQNPPDPEETADLEEG